MEFFNFKKTSTKFLNFKAVKLKLCLLLKKWVGHTSSKIELNNNNFKKLYNIKIVNIWSKAPQELQKRANVLNNDSNI